VRWSFPNLRGDVLKTVTGTTVDAQVYRWDPDGMPIAGGVRPNLQAGNFENGWLGQHQWMTDTTDAANPIVEMGARVYLPRLAKFTAPDPVEGGVGDADYLSPQTQSTATTLPASYVCLRKTRKVVVGVPPP
jgi:hypothetical protein